MSTKPPTVQLTPGQDELLRNAADNDGRIFIGTWSSPLVRKSGAALTRMGLFAAGPNGIHWITAHGWAWLAQQGEG